MEEAGLLEAARRGDTQAFGRLVVLHAPAVLRFVGGLAALPADEREDIVQEAFVRAFAKLDQFDPTKKFAPWVAGFARLVLLEQLARHKRAEEARQRLVQAALTEASIRRAQEGNASRMDALERCIELLPEPMRRILQQHYAEGRPLADIAVALDRPLGTVKSVLHRSRLEVRNCIARKLTRPEESPA